LDSIYNLVQYITKTNPKITTTATTNLSTNPNNIDTIVPLVFNPEIDSVERQQQEQNNNNNQNKYQQQQSTTTSNSYQTSTTTYKKKIIVPILPRISILNRYATRDSKRSIINVNKVQSIIQTIIDTYFELNTTSTTTTNSNNKNNNNQNHNQKTVTIQYIDDGTSFLQQIQYFSNVDILVSPHGAQLTGIFFMPPKCSHVIEIILSTWIESNFFGSLASSINIKYNYLLVLPPQSSSSSSSSSSTNSNSNNNHNNNNNNQQQMMYYNTTIYNWETTTIPNNQLRYHNICVPISNIVHVVLHAIYEWYACISTTGSNDE
jgi:Glycosyltransferase 61